MIDNVLPSAYIIYLLIAKFIMFVNNNIVDIFRILINIPKFSFNKIHLDRLVMNQDFRLVSACQLHAQSKIFKL